jgi:hypothetical protein
VDLAPHLVAGFHLWMWGLKNVLMNDHSKEEVFPIIPLVPLMISMH